jgi:hypothetical protein
LSIALDLSRSVSSRAVTLDRQHLNGFIVIRIIGREQVRSFARPSFASEYVAFYPTTTEALLQGNACRSPFATVRPTERNVKNLTVGQALKARVELSGAFKLGAYTPQRVLQVLVKRGGLQPFPSLCLCLSALMTVKLPRHVLFTVLLLR